MVLHKVKYYNGKFVNKNGNKYENEFFYIYIIIKIIIIIKKFKVMSNYSLMFKYIIIGDTGNIIYNIEVLENHVLFYN